MRRVFHFLLFFALLSLVGPACLTSPDNTSIEEETQAGEEEDLAYTYRLGGEVSGLSGKIILRVNNSEALTLTSNGVFQFTTLLNKDDHYSVEIVSFPNTSNCTIAHPSGTILSNTNTLDVVCHPLADCFPKNLGTTVTALPTFNRTPTTPSNLTVKITADGFMESVDGQSCTNPLNIKTTSATRTCQRQLNCGGLITYSYYSVSAIWILEHTTHPNIWYTLSPGVTAENIAVLPTYADVTTLSCGQLNAEINAVNAQLAVENARLSGGFSFNTDQAQVGPRGAILILDLDGDGLENRNQVNVVAAGEGFLFTDLSTRLQARLTNWVHPNEGILIWDRNGDGVIAAEDFFGDRNFTHRDVDNGYEDLALFDDNGDGVVDGSDSNFEKLRIWKDSSTTIGTVEPWEILTLAHAGVARLNLAYRDQDPTALSITQLATYKSTTAVSLDARLVVLNAEVAARCP